MMLDADVVAVSPSSVWRVLQQAGLLSRWKGKPSRKASGFEQPPHAQQHWYIDVSYINVSGMITSFSMRPFRAQESAPDMARRCGST
jgi:hypothetical protein